MICPSSRSSLVNATPAFANSVKAFSKSSELDISHSCGQILMKQLSRRLLRGRPCPRAVRRSASDDVHHFSSYCRNESILDLSYKESILTLVIPIPNR